MISSQIDADRMDYLLRDAYFTGTEYGTFDLTRILRVIRPYKGGIAFAMNGCMQWKTISLVVTKCMSKSISTLFLVGWK